MAGSYDHLLKILLVGDSDVGKTGIILRFCDDFKNTSSATQIGVDFRIRTKEMDGETIKFQIWDTAGQESFKTITTSYYRGAKGIMLVYDVHNQESFTNTLAWLKNIQEHATEEIVIILIGHDHQVDPNESSTRQVTVEQGQQLANDHGLRFMEVSSKNNLNIEEAFCTLARDYISKLKNTQKQCDQVDSAQRTVPDKPAAKSCAPS
ncbi:hypothetical protein Btru_044091 [Bulinus truncatus]|nr:hypothetical protein Btru_044091 [Bulinus truncatus]